MQPTNNYSEEGLEKLKSSGISSSDAKKLGIKEVVLASTINQNYDARPALLFTYCDLTGDSCPTKDFHRIRYLTPPTGFSAQTTKGNQKYAQPAGSLNWVYLPNILDWKTIAATPATRILITEGELKAACACLHGLPTIGLGGVDVFHSKKKDVDALPPLDEIVWKNRSVVIVFDTDETSGLKDTVAKAAKRLMLWLLKKGAIPSLAVLPHSGSKTGFDDYLVANGVDKFVTEVLNNAKCTSTNETAARLLFCADNYDWVQPYNRFVILNDESSRVQLYADDHFNKAVKNVITEITMPVAIKRSTRGGTTVVVEDTPLTPSEAMLIWPGFQRSMGVVYKPGYPRRCYDAKGNKYTNLWKGWHCEYEHDNSLPSKREMDHAIGEWYWALDNVFGDDPVARRYIEDWLLYPLHVTGRDIGTPKERSPKMRSFILVLSTSQKIGKSFVGHTFANYVYGARSPGICHAFSLKEGDLAAPFNPYLFANSFVVGDEIASSDKKSAYEKLKSHVSEDTATINMKNQPQVQIDNFANFYISSNDLTSLDIKDADSRAMVHIPRYAKSNDKRYTDLDFLFSDKGHNVAGKALLNYARNIWTPSAAFSPKDAAPRTSSRGEVVRNTNSILGQWCEDLAVHVDSLSRPIATSDELWHMFLLDHPESANHYKIDALGKALSSVGFRRMLDGKQIWYKSHDGKSVRQRIWKLRDDRVTQTMSEHDATQLIQTPLTLSSKIVKFPAPKMKGTAC